MTIPSSIRSLVTAAFAASALAGLSAGAFAADADDNRLDGAWEDLVIDQEGILTEGQFAKLNNLAFQAAATKVCDGYEVDQRKMAEATAAALAVPPPGMSDNDAKRWEAAVLFRFGANYGLFLAEGNANAKTFCESAAELKAATDAPNIWADAK